jgi:uncharacterized membrane protein YjfL (UPF0719 family)
MDALKISLEQVFSAIPLVITILLIAFGARWIFQQTTRYCINEELTDRDNPAFGVAFGGYMVGVAIALSGTLLPWDAVHSFVDLLTIAFFGVVGTLLMRASLWINDAAILHQFPIEKELVIDHNLGTGFVVAGSSIATGFMLRGVMAGYSDSLLLGVRDIAVYFLTGQCILIFGAWVYVKTARYDIHKQIEKRNIAAGISMGGYLAALGYIVSTALTGSTSVWMDEIITSFAISLVGILLLVIAHVFVDYAMLPKSPLVKEIVEDRNTAAGVVAAASFLLVAILFAGSVHPARLGASGVDVVPTQDELREEPASPPQEESGVTEEGGDR